MGKGDRKTKRGKMWRASHGKTRPSSQKIRAIKKKAEEK
ncbi:MAG TPA: 30S ribosomal protein THX [bacterium]|nr:30S ribosomal protein THX [bacterium]